MFRFIDHKNIDKEKWDRLVLNSINGNIYSSSLYLDSLADEWHIVILNDYEAGIALPARKKFGINYIYPPFFTQQLGWIFQKKENNYSIDEVLNYVPKKFRLIEHNLNSLNFFKQPNNNYLSRSNYLLPLNQNFETLSKSFSRSALRNIKKAIAEKIVIKQNIDFNAVLDIHLKRFDKETGVDKESYENFRGLLHILNERKFLFAIGALNGAGQLISGGIFTIFKNRITFILNGNTPKSLENGASHMLLNETIKHFSNQQLILDFEGSDNPSFARFYEQYGAKPETYYFLTFNKLPKVLKIISGKKD